MEKRQGRCGVALHDRIVGHRYGDCGMRVEFAARDI
jgi:hypothetical protein